jgi:histidinol phosphatase-like enzyme
VKLIILDREGVVCEPERGMNWSTQGFRLLDGAAEAIARFNHAGYQVALLQDCEALHRGVCDMDRLNRLHADLLQALAQRGARVDVLLFADALTRSITDLMNRLRATAAQTLFVSGSAEHLASALEAGCRAIRLLCMGPTLASGADPASAIPEDALLRVDLGAVAREVAH